jgi:hypothetical protein
MAVRQPPPLGAARRRAPARRGRGGNFYPFHQSDVAFLNQVGVRQAATGESAGHAHDVAQIAEDQLAHGESGPVASELSMTLPDATAV